MAEITPKHKFLVVLCCLLVLSGCRNKSNPNTNDPAADATGALSKIKSDLTKTRREINDLKEELSAVKDIRDELDKKVAQMTIERNNAVEAAKETEQRLKDLTAQFGELPEDLKALEKELNERNTLIESQQITINDQQATIAEQQKIIAEQDEAIASLEKVLQEQMATEEQPQEEEPQEVPEQ